MSSERISERHDSHDTNLHVRSSIHINGYMLRRADDLVAADPQPGNVSERDERDGNALGNSVPDASSSLPEETTETDETARRPTRQTRYNGANSDTEGTSDEQ